MKRGLVLSGGGVKGAYSVGVLLTLDKEYDYIAGISVGAILAFQLAHHKKTKEGAEELLDLWKRIKSPSDIIRVFKAWPPNRTWTGPLQYFFTDGIFCADPLRKLLDGIYKPEKIKEAGKELHIGYVDKNTGDYLEANENTPDLVDYVLASASFPVGMQSVKKNGRVMSDGGHITMTPIRQAIEAGCTEIDIVLTAPFENMGVVDSEKMKSLWQSTARTLEIMTSILWKKDLKECHRINNFLKQGIQSDKFSIIDVTIYAPQRNFPYFPLDFHPDKIAFMIDEGAKCKPMSLEKYIEG